jgi:hypothetical protein
MGESLRAGYHAGASGRRGILGNDAVLYEVEWMLLVGGRREGLVYACCRLVCCRREGAMDAGRNKEVARGSMGFCDFVKVCACSVCVVPWSVEGRAIRGRRVHVCAK